MHESKDPGSLLLLKPAGEDQHACHVCTQVGANKLTQAFRCRKYQAVHPPAFRRFLEGPNLLQGFKMYLIVKICGGHESSFRHICI